VDLVLVAFGALFAVFYLLLAFIRTVRRTPEIARSDIALVFLVALVSLAGLIVSGQDGVTDNLVEVAVLGIAITLAVFGVIFIISELFRPQRLRQSRGVLTLGLSMLLALSALLVPLAAAYFSLPPRQQPVPVVNQTESDASAEFYVVFSEVVDIIGDASGLSQDEVLTALDNGETVAQLIATNNGDIEQVIDDITRVMQNFLRSLAAQERVDPLRASAGIAGMEIVVRYAVNNDLSTLQRAGRENTAATLPPEGTARPSFFAFLTASFTPVGIAQTALPATDTPLPTITPPPTARASATRTPRPTATETATRERFVTRTPTPTPTLPSPCLAQMEYNVNLRAEAATESALLATIPFETVVNVFGRNEETTWWYVEYEGNAGWVSDEFVTVTSSCSKLPVRD
jgi:hypothetical protein